MADMADNTRDEIYIPDSLERCDFLNLGDIVITGDGLAITAYPMFTVVETLLEGVSVTDLETIQWLWAMWQSGWDVVSGDPTDTEES